MTEPILVLENSEGTERLLITQRLDGAYTYRRQWRNIPTSSLVPPEDYEWGPFGPDCGIYDSAETAEIEARQRIKWLKDVFQ